MTLPIDVALRLPEPRTPDPHDAPAIRWGILAPGGIAHAFADAVAVGTASSVVAVGSRSRERAQDFADEFAIPRAHGSYEELVADTEVDAVYVASPHSEHRDHALLALEAGKPVLVEKAFTRSAAEAREVLAAAERQGLLVVEAMWSRFLPHYDVVRHVVETGLIGELVSVFADHGQRLYPDGPGPALPAGARGRGAARPRRLPRVVRRPRARRADVRVGGRHADRPRRRCHDDHHGHRRRGRTRRPVLHDGRRHAVHRRRRGHRGAARAVRHLLRRRLDDPAREPQQRGPRRASPAVSPTTCAASPTRRPSSPAASSPARPSHRSCRTRRRCASWRRWMTYAVRSGSSTRASESPAWIPFRSSSRPPRSSSSPLSEPGSGVRNFFLADVDRGSCRSWRG